MAGCNFNLQRLLLKNCSRLRNSCIKLIMDKFGETLTHLDLSGTRISEFDVSDNHLSRLREIRLEFCTRLVDWKVSPKTYPSLSLLSTYGTPIGSPLRGSASLEETSASLVVIHHPLNAREGQLRAYAKSRNIQVSQAATVELLSVLKH